MPRWWAALLVGLVASSSSSSPNTDSCYFNNDGVCDDGVYGACLCGTDYSDCGFVTSVTVRRGLRLRRIRHLRGRLMTLKATTASWF